MKKYVLIILDGAADITTINGKTPLEIARIPNIDYLTQHGVTGLMQTLYTDLPKGSIVAQLGIFGYDPYQFFPYGRASCEAMAIDVDLEEGDLAFRANLSYIKDNILDSYNAHYIKSKDAIPLIKLLQNRLNEKYPNIELYHNSDFRNVMILRDANIHPLDSK